MSLPESVGIVDRIKNYSDIYTSDYSPLWVSLSNAFQTSYACL